MALKSQATTAQDPWSALAQNAKASTSTVRIALPHGTTPDRARYDLITPQMELDTRASNKSGKLYFRIVTHAARVETSGKHAGQASVEATRASFRSRGLTDAYIDANTIGAIEVDTPKATKPAKASKSKFARNFEAAATDITVAADASNGEVHAS